MSDSPIGQVEQSDKVVERSDEIDQSDNIEPSDDALDTNVLNMNEMMACLKELDKQWDVPVEKEMYTDVINALTPIIEKYSETQDGELKHKTRGLVALTICLQIYKSALANGHSLNVHFDHIMMELSENL